MKKANVFFGGLLTVLLIISFVFIGCEQPIQNPDPPAGVTAESSSTNSIVVTWGAVSGASGYNIYRGMSLAAAFQKIGSSDSTVYTDFGLLSGTTYYYRVAAYTKQGEGSQSYHAYATTEFDAPTNVQATADTAAMSITVSWNAVSNAAYYIVYRSDSAYGNYTQVTTSNTTSYTNTGLTANTTYYYKVAAVGTTGTVSTGLQSEYVSATTKFAAPTNVLATSPTTTGSKSVTVTWNAVSGATSYYIYRSDSAYGDYTQVGNSSTTSYTNTVPSSGTYYYKVAAVGITGTGLQSSYVGCYAY